MRACVRVNVSETASNQPPDLTLTPSAHDWTQLVISEKYEQLHNQKCGDQLSAGLKLRQRVCFCTARVPLSKDSMVLSAG